MCVCLFVLDSLVVCWLFCWCVVCMFGYVWFLFITIVVFGVGWLCLGFCCVVV